MGNNEYFSDRRLDYLCAYCGDMAQTRDHVPSKVLLDNPLPPNLAVVPCCQECNAILSRDEEYFAALLECCYFRTTEIESLERVNIKRSLKRSLSILEQVKHAFFLVNGQSYFDVNDKRVKNVILKLARGHLKHQNSESVLKVPSSYWVKPLHFMDANEQKSFFSLGKSYFLPEVGSRAFLKVVLNGDGLQSTWNEVQKDNYYFAIRYAQGYEVKIFIRNFLAVMVGWHT